MADIPLKSAQLQILERKKRRIVATRFLICSGKSPIPYGLTKGAAMPDGYQQDQGPVLQATAAPVPPPCVPVTLDMDADVLGWLQEQPLWRREINALLRAYMEVDLIRKTAFEDAAADQQGDF